MQAERRFKLTVIRLNGQLGYDAAVVHGPL
jgi:hypothetical protein